MAIENPLERRLVAEVKQMSEVLDARAAEREKLLLYDRGGCPIPDAVVQANLTNAYRTLMTMAEAPWGSLIVDSVQDRLQVTGINTGSASDDDRLWGWWQDNAMDAESKLGHRSALRDGRAFAMVWDDPDNPGGDPEITLDNCTTMVVKYRDGSRRKRVAALRRFILDDLPHATLYHPDSIYKFVGPKESSGAPATEWERREIDGEDWPMKNPLKRVPVVELPVNRELEDGAYAYARGEYANCVGLMDRINLLTFLGLVVAIWMGFPLRYMLGGKILRDDDGNKLPPFESKPDSVVQDEDPATKIGQLDAADRKNLSIFAELDQLAVVTKTPRHYFPLEQGLSNLSAEAIHASEGGLHAKVPSHKDSLGEAWEEVMRLGGAQFEDAIEVPTRAELSWADHESRSLAERADAASKLKDILPWQVLAEKVLKATQGDIGRWQSMRNSDAFTTLLEQTTKAMAAPVVPEREPEPVPA